MRGALYGASGLSAVSPILQIAYALVGAYRSLGVKHASRNPNQTPCLPPRAWEGVGLRQFSFLVFIVESEAFTPIRYRFLTEVRFRPMSAMTFVSSINQYFATHRNIKSRIADKLLHLNTQRVHSHQANNVFQMEQTHDHHLHHPL
jgi:hypothetical protein